MAGNQNQWHGVGGLPLGAPEVLEGPADRAAPEAVSRPVGGGSAERVGSESDEGGVRDYLRATVEQFHAGATQFSPGHVGGTTPLRDPRQLARLQLGWEEYIRDEERLIDKLRVSTGGVHFVQGLDPHGIALAVFVSCRLGIQLAISGTALMAADSGEKVLSIIGYAGQSSEYVPYMRTGPTAALYLHKSCDPRPEIVVAEIDQSIIFPYE